MKYLASEDATAYEELMKKIKFKKIAGEDVLPQVKLNVPEETEIEEEIEEVAKEE
jgi:hypothetical protein